MERIIEVGGKAILLGLEWSKLAGEKPAESARRSASLRKCPMGIVWSVSVEDDSSSSSQVIHSLGLSKEKHKGSIYSGAAIIAGTGDGVIGIQAIDEDLYWMVVTENGRVLPGYDSVCSELELKKKINELASDAQLDYMQFYMDEDTAFVFGIDEYTAQSPIDLISSQSLSEKMKVKKMAGIPRAVFMGIAVIILGGLFFAYTKHIELEKQRELERLIAEESMNLDDIEDQITVDNVIDKGPTDADILRQARQEEITWLLNDFNNVNLIPTMKGMLFTLEKMPLSISGWTNKSISFNASQSKSIGVLWSRDHGSPSSLNEFMKAHGRVGFTPDFSAGSGSIPVDFGSPEITDILSVVKDKKTSHQDFASSLIESGVKFSSGIVDSTERKEPIKGLSTTGLEGMTQLEVSKRSFSLTGEDIYKFVEAMYVFENIQNFLLERIEFTPQNKATSWKVEGTLYE